MQNCSLRSGYDIDWSKIQIRLIIIKGVISYRIMPSPIVWKTDINSISVLPAALGTKKTARHTNLSVAPTLVGCSDVDTGKTPRIVGRIVECMR